MTRPDYARSHFAATRFTQNGGLLSFSFYGHCKDGLELDVRLLILLMLGFSCCSVWAEEEGGAFDILEYQVDGNTVLPQGKIEEAIYPYMGEGKSIATVEEARVALEKTYRDAGYPTVFVNIPEQEVNGGMVRLQVSEGDVERLRVVGAHYYSLGTIRERVPELAEGKVPHFPTVQKQLATVNRGTDRQVAPVLRPGKSPGKVEVDLKVQDHSPFHGGIELNNRYSANTTHTRLNGSMRYDNLWQSDHSLGISFQVSPENTDETKVLSATYLVPRLNGDYLALYGIKSESDIAAIGDVGVVGNGTIFGVRYIHPMPGVGNYFHTLTLGADYKDFDETTVLQGADSFNTPITYMPFYLGYDGTLRSQKSETQATLGLTFSLRGFVNDEQEFAEKRFLAQSNFAALRADIEHTQQLGDWKLNVRLASQLASGPLISSEQFAVGGADSVRGYMESNSMGDDGVYGSLELRTPSMARHLPGEIKELYALAFTDAGHARVREPLPAQTEKFDLASAGLGLRLKGLHGLSGALDYARALRTSGQIKNGDDRLHFRVSYDW